MSAVAVAAALAMAAGAGCSRDEGQRTPRDDARRACDHAVRFEQAVREDRSIEEVRRRLDAAREAALRASRADAEWNGLTSALDALALALREDDPEAARVGMSVVRTECAHARRQA